MPKNPKGDPLGSINVFYKTKTSKKFKAVSFDRIQKFPEKAPTKNRDLLFGDF